MALRKCAHCGEREEKEGMVITPIAAFCNFKCAGDYGQERARKQREKAIQKQARAKKESDKAFRRETKRRKEAILGRKELLPRLQDLVNQWVVHVRDAGQPCCTCGTESQSIKYDAGHWLTRGARGDIALNLYNINKQCSIQCNVHRSGAQGEHEQFIGDKYGGHIVAWLRSNTHPSMKELFPLGDDVRAEMGRYRKLLRAEGLKPRW